MLAAGVEIFLVVIAMVGGVILTLVVVPFQARGHGDFGDDSIRGTATASWLFGLLGVLVSSEHGSFFTLFGRPLWRIEPDDEETKAKRKAKKEEKRRKKADKKKRKKKAKKAKKPLRDRLAWLFDHQSTLRRFVGRLMGTCRLRVRVEGTVALDDPADTAAVVAALRTVGGLATAARIDVQPDYLDETTQLAVEVRGRVWILAILWVAVSSLLEIRTWKLLRGLA